MQNEFKYYTFYNTLSNEEIDTISLNAGATIDEDLENKRRSLASQKNIALENIGFTELLEKNLDDFNIDTKS